MNGQAPRDGDRANNHTWKLSTSVLSMNSWFDVGEAGEHLCQTRRDSCYTEEDQLPRLISRQNCCSNVVEHHIAVAGGGVRMSRRPILSSERNARHLRFFPPLVKPALHALQDRCDSKVALVK